MAELGKCMRKCTGHPGYKCFTEMHMGNPSLHCSEDEGTEHEKVMSILVCHIADLPTDGYRPGKGGRVYDRGGLRQSHC